jgi:putative ABC transport system permease protein
MLRNCLAATRRHLNRNRLHTLISVVGLAVGLCTALITVLVIRNQYSYDHDIAGYQRTYTVLTALNAPGARQYFPATLFPLAAQLPQQSPAIEAASLVVEEERASVTHGATTSSETIHWADANLHQALPLPVSAGNLAEALRSPDGLVLSRSAARRIFGRDAPLDEQLTVKGQTMVVRAVLQDRHANTTNMGWELIASRASAAAPDSAQQADAYRESGAPPFADGSTYVRLRPGATALSLQRDLRQILQPMLPANMPADLDLWVLEPVRIDQLNTHEALHPGFHARMMMLSVLGAVVLLIAAVNFVNLQTAGSVPRAREVAIRALAGAGRSTLMQQFLGEALIYATAAALLAIALAEWLLPQVNAFLDSGASLSLGREPWLLGALGGATVLFALLAGFWPALVLSAFRPITVLRNTTALVPGGAIARQGLVALQFALLITLTICAGVVYRQREFALSAALRMDHDQMLMIVVPFKAPHREAFGEELRKLPGVRTLAWTDASLLGSAGFGPVRALSVMMARLKNGETVSLNEVGVDFNLFDAYNIKPLAGRLPTVGDARITDPKYLVLNETAARKFDLWPPTLAIGRIGLLGTPNDRGSPDKPPQTEVLAVVPDFSFDSIEKPIPPTYYYQTAQRPQLINAHLTGNNIPETLAAIDETWNRMGNGNPLLRFFLDEHLQRHYQGVLRQSQAFGICALIAAALSCIGLFALTAAMARRRRKEIGIRKALGADTRDVLKLLLWQFSQPVLWASLIAWLAAGWLMHRWLAGFAYRIDLPLWLFPTSSVVALAIALLTVSAHAVLVARARPVEALRCE